MRASLAIAFTAAALFGCQSTPEDAPRATAGLKPLGNSKVIGEATFDQVGNKVRVVAYVQGLKPGQEHGFHIHEDGDCSSPDGMSAKGHFNPFGKPHGHPTSAERHAGDLPALKADKSGRAKLDVELDTITVTPGPTTIVGLIVHANGPPWNRRWSESATIVGRGLIVHADPDDYKTQPTGNAGARLACGVIQRN